MTIILQRHARARVDERRTHHHTSVTVRNIMAISNNTLKSVSTTGSKLNKPLIAIVVIAASVILGIFICISWALRIRKEGRGSISGRRSGPEKHPETPGVDLELNERPVLAPSIPPRTLGVGWLPQINTFRSRDLIPEPYTLSQPSIHSTISPISPSLSTPRTGQRPASPIDSVIDVSNKPARESSPPPPPPPPRLQPPVYVPSATSTSSAETTTFRALPSPPGSSSKRDKKPSTKKNSADALGRYLRESLHTPPPAYKRSHTTVKSVPRKITHPLPQTPPRDLPPRPSSSTAMSPALTPSVANSISIASPLASGSRHGTEFGPHMGNGNLPRLMTVTNTFVPTFPDEIGVTFGDTVLLLEESGDNWCVVQLLGNTTARQGVVSRFCLDEYTGVTRP